MLVGCTSSGLVLCRSTLCAPKPGSGLVSSIPVPAYGSFCSAIWAYGVVDQSIEQCAIFYYATFKLTPSMHR